MIVGKAPFSANNHKDMFELIKHGQLTWPKPSQLLVSFHAQDLISKLLEKDPNKRLGHNGANEIKSHKWFENVSWDDLIEKNVLAPYIPSLKDKYDTSNFDEEFTNQEARNSVIRNGNKQIVNNHQEDFINFTYIPKQL